MTTATTTWTGDNQAYLATSLRRLRRLIAQDEQPAPDDDCDLDDLAARMARPPSLLALTAAFGLSAFERDLLLMCAGLELDADFAVAVCGTGDASAPARPTFGSALAVLPGGHWSALAPSAPLRRWRLLELDVPGLLTHAPLRAAERVVHFLAGVQTVDAELEGVVTVEECRPEPAELAPSHARLADRAVRAFTSAAPLATMPLIQLVGRDDSVRDLAAGIAGPLGFGPQFP